MAGGEPTWQKPEAHRLAEEGQFKGLGQHFPSEFDAFGYFAASRAERYSLEAAGGSCCDCGRGAEGGVARAQWDYRFPDFKASVVEALGMIGHAHVDRHRHGTFVTYHAACGGCVRRWRPVRTGARTW